MKKIVFFVIIVLVIPVAQDATATTADIFIKLGKELEKKGEWGKAAEHYKAIFTINPVSLDQKIEANFRYGRALILMGEQTDGENVFRKLSKLYNQNGNTFISKEKRAYVGQARFILNEDAFTKATKPYNDASVPLKRFLAQRENTLVKMKRGYEQVIAVDSAEWVLASLFRIGLANEITAKTILEAPLPKYLSDKNRDEFHLTLRNRGLPYEDRAIVMYKKVLALDERQKIGGEWIRLTKIHLNNLLKPSR
ncbi:tetratricopeptide repeat protein [Bdellovibrionota bacterium]